MRRQQKKGVLKMPYLNLKGEMAKKCSYRRHFKIVGFAQKLCGEQN